MQNNPSWLTALTEPLLQRIAEWEVFPFDQPSETDGFLSCHHNDYLRLSAHPDVIEAKNEATQKTGSGAMASLVYGGNHSYHNRFRQRVAEVSLLPSPDSVVLTTCGWTANVGLMEAVVMPQMPIYMDLNAHASLWDGARLSAGKLIPVRHNRPDMMARYIEKYGPGVMVIDGFYSTHGSVAPLIEYVELAEKTDCLLVLDEAHSFGMTGKNGGGLAVEAGCAERVPIRTVSLAKALGGNGGFILADPHTAYFLSYRLRPLIFSSSPPPSNSAGNLAALEVLIREPDRARGTLEKAAYFRKILNEGGVDTGPSKCQIVSLYFDSEQTACTLYGKLKEQGVLFSVFLAPAVPRNSSLARFSIYSELTNADIEIMADKILKTLVDMGVESKYPEK